MEDDRRVPSRWSTFDLARPTWHALSVAGGSTRFADESHAGGDRRVPALVDLPLELLLVHAAEIAGGRKRHLVVVADEQIGVGDPDRVHLLGGVPMADVLGVVGQSEAFLPLLPHVRLPREVGDVVVLDSRQMPQQPADRVAGSGGTVAQSLMVEAVCDFGVELGDPAEASVSTPRTSTAQPAGCAERTCGALDFSSFIASISPRMRMRSSSSRDTCA